MTRPAFLSRPGIWTRTARTAQSPVDYACAVEHNVRSSPWHVADLLIAAGFVAFLAVIVFWS